MKIRSLYQVLLALFAIGSVFGQNAEELPIPVETDNQFPPEHSELDGQSEGSVSTAIESVEPIAGSINSNVPAPTFPKEDQQVIDEDSEIQAAEPSPTLESQKTDATASTSTTQYEQKADSDAGSETAAAEPMQIDARAESPEPQPTTLADEAVPAIEDDDEQKADSAAGSETAAAELIHTDAGSESPEPQPTTLADEAVPAIEDDDERLEAGSVFTSAEPSKTDVDLESPQPELKTTLAVSAVENNDEQKVELDANSETEARKPSRTDVNAESPEPQPEKTLADESVPAIEKYYEQITKNEGSEVIAAEASQIQSISEVANDEEHDTNKEVAAEAAATESAIADMIEPNLTTKQERDVSDTDSEVVPVQPAEETSGSETVDVSAPLLESDADHDTDNEGSETTTAEPAQVVPDEVDQVLTTINDQDVTTEGSDTTVIDSAKITTESPDTVVDAPKAEDTQSQCPEPCICITEGDSNNYIVDCSGHGLTELPTPIDPKTTTLKLQNNQFSTIPQAISEIKNLKNLYANDNLIAELQSGSVSALPELVSLNLANNNLQEYPKDLENALNLDKLEELDLSGNELKLTPDIFLNLKALRIVTFPEVSSDLVTNLCTLKESLTAVCTKSCSEHSLECSEVRKDHSLDATLPGMIPFFPDINKEKNAENSDDTHANSEISETQKSVSQPEEPETPTKTKETPDIVPLTETASTSGTKEIPTEQPVPENPTEKVDEPKDTPNIVQLPEIPSTSGAKEMPSEPPVPEKTSETKDNSPVDDFSLRNAVNNAPQENVAVHSTIVETPKESPKSNNETDVKVGAKTTETKGGGGVDKSVIAIIVAGMVIVIAVITIKKNWSSIRKRFSSSPGPNERSGRNTNGTAVSPEEVPLQDKSPA